MEKVGPDLKLEETRNEELSSNLETRWVESEKKRKAASEWLDKQFDIDELVDNTDQIRETIIEYIGKVKYKDLSSQEMIELSREGEKLDRFDLGIKIVTKMLFKADKKTTEEKLRQISPRYLKPLVEGLTADFLE